MERVTHIAEAEAAGRALWHQAACTMGMDPRAFTVRLEHARGSGGRARTLIYLIEGEGQRLYLKHDPEQREEVFRASQEAHAVVERALWASDGFGIVPILHSDVQERVVVMPFIEGQSARERLILAREGAGRPADILRDCGRWLSHLHENAGPLVETRDFKWIARRARTFAERVRSGAQAVAHPKRFLGLCAMVHRLVREMQDQPVHLSGLHGDAHAANFIYADEGLIAIDVTGRGHGPRVWDLARLLARYLYNLGRDPKGSEQWAGLRMEDLDALSVGYQRDVRTEPGLLLFLVLMMMNDWVALTPEPGAIPSLKSQRANHLRDVFLSLREAGY